MELTIKHLLILLLLASAHSVAYAQKPLLKPSKTQLRLEQWHRQDYQRPVDEAQRRLDAVQSDLDLFLNTPVEKRQHYFDDVIASQRLLVEKYAGELKAAQDKLATFDRMLADPGARAVFHKQLKEQAKAAQVYRGPRFSVSIRCYSYSTRYTFRARCDVY